MATERLKSAIRFLDRDQRDYSTSEPASEAAGMNLALSLQLDTILAFILVATFWGLVLYAAAMTVALR